MKRMKRWIASGAVLVAVMWATGCQERQSPCSCDREVVLAPVAMPPSVPATPKPELALEETMKPEDLLHRRFALASVNGKEFTIDDPARRPTIEFNETFQIAGRVCNTFRGPAQLKDGKLLAENLAMTRMMCGGELDEVERLFVAMLRTGADITLSEHGTRLTLSQGETVLVYTRADWVR